MLKPISKEMAEESFERVVEAFGLGGLGDEERVRKLVELDVRDIVEKTPMGVPLVPFVDGELVTGYLGFRELEEAKERGLGKSWCRALMTGHCEHDVRSAFPFPFPLSSSDLILPFS